MMADQSSAKDSPPLSLQATEGIVEPEEKPTSSSSGSTSSTPPWVRWSRGLHSLLDDSEGVELFELYLSQEGCSAQLNFLWACEGLKSTGLDDPPKIPQLIRSIYRNLIQNSNLLGVGEETRSEITQWIKGGKFTTEIFDKAQAEVEVHMQDNLYPNFIKSEIFLSAAAGEFETSTRSCEEALGSTSSLGSRSVGTGANVSASVSLSAADRSQSQSTDRILSDVASKLQVDPLTGEILQSATALRLADGELSPLQISGPSTPPNAAINVLNLLPNQLQTVHEDKELSVNPPPAAPPPHNAKSYKLTKDILLATQRERASAVSVSGSIPVVGNGKVRKGESLSGHYHANKGSLTTAPFPYHVMYSAYNPVSRVDSEIQSMSSDAMTDDGGHAGHHQSSSKKHGPHHHKSQHSQMPPSSRHLEKISQFQSGAAAMAIQNRDNLHNFNNYARDLMSGKKQCQKLDPKDFAALLMSKLEEVKKKREVDEKLNRRMSERDEGSCSTDGLTSHVLAAAIEKLQVQDDGLPDDILDKHVSRIWSDITPDPRSPKLRSPLAGRRRGLPPQHCSGALLHRQRRDRDVVSTFSADSGNVNDYVPEAPSSPSIMFIPKSRSVPYDLKGSDGDPSQFSLSSQGQRGRSTRGSGFGQSDPRKISATMLTKKSSNEYLDSGISVVSGTAPPGAGAPVPACSYDWSRHSMVNQWVEQAACDEKPRVRSTTSPTVSGRQKKATGGAISSQSQPMFQPVPNMEEVSRRLNKKFNYPAQHQLSGPYSFSSTLPRRHHSQPHQAQEDSFVGGVSDFSVSSFVFYEDSDVPYGFKIPCKGRTGGVTLAIFKEHLPKRGHFRFFFKKECAELDAKVVQEEVTDDCQILPLYEGKIIAHLQTATTSSSSLLQ